MRRLTIWTSAHYADGTLTAHLSDGSAPDFVQTIDAPQGSPGPSNNLPAVFTLDYKAAIGRSDPDGHVDGVRARPGQRRR